MIWIKGRLSVKNEISTDQTTIEKTLPSVTQ